MDCAGSGDIDYRRSKSHTNCCVPQCTSFHGKDRFVSFHSFPRNEELKKQWIHVLKLGKKPGTAARVCSKHFEPSDIRDTGKRKWVKEGVVPSKNLPSSTFDKTRGKKQKIMEDLRKARAQGRQSTRTAEGDADGSMETQSSESEAEEHRGPCPDQTGQQPDLADVADENTTAVLNSIGVQVNTFLESSLEGMDIMENFSSDKNLKIATGIDSVEIFKALVQCCSARTKKRTGDMHRNVIITFMKLKHGMSFSLLSVLFRVSVPTVSSVFSDTITLLGVVLSSAIMWPDKEEVSNNMPKCFEKFQKTRLVVDCTEVPVESPKCLSCRLKCYSHYKGQQTCKFLIGVSPAGLITALSVPWGGRASDKAIFEHMEVLNDLEPFVDAVMADKGFHVEKVLEERGIELYRPPFLRKSRQFCKADALNTVEIAAARVHVERVIGRVKSFKILQQTIPWRMVPYLNSIVVVICGITNLSRPVLSEDKFL